MTSKLTGRPVISGFTTSILRASGWYQVSSDIEEQLEWGFGKGCSFLNDQCIQVFDEFCKIESEMNCTVDFSGKTFCDVDKYTDNCSINAFLSSFQCDSHPAEQIRTSDFEIFGQYSRCLPLMNNEQKKTGCFQTRCDSSMNKISISYQVNELTSSVECTEKDEKVVLDEESGISILCPDPTYFCQKSGVLNCSNDCNGVGVCKKDKKCFCDILYEGDDCSQMVQCNDSLCQDLIRAQNFSSLLMMSILSFYTLIFQVD
jgi:hypothetical protein